MHDQQITYLSSNQLRTHTVRFLCCFAVTIASNVEACAYLSSAVFCRHCRDVSINVCHGSTISSADFLRKLNHPTKVGQHYRSSDSCLTGLNHTENKQKATQKKNSYKTRLVAMEIK